MIELSTLAAALLARCPVDAVRIDRAVGLVLAGHVEPPVTGTQWIVRSETDPTRAYLTDGWSCSCPDHVQREARCKHAWARVLYGALEDARRYAAKVDGPRQAQGGAS